MERIIPELLADSQSDLPAAQYRQAVVTFIDILGFRTLVKDKSASEVAAAISRLQATVQPPQAGTKRAQSVQPIVPSHVHAFSDCVVRVRPVSQSDEFGRTFIRELADLASIQASLACAGVFIRGGVTCDRLYSTDKAVFGPGLIRAYDLETQLAHVPRIVIDPATIQKFRGRDIPPSRMQTDITAMRKSIRQADDGLWFVDYLRAGAAALADDAKIRDFLREHGEKITEAAASIDVVSSVLPKYLWAAKYHNASCQRLLGRASIPGITLNKSQLPSFERLRLPQLLKH